jgi:basic membrane protein A and related proteins
MKLFAACMLAFVVLGCKGGGEENGQASGTSEKTFKVALLTPGPVSDSGWSAMAYDGLQAIKTEMGAEVSNQEAKSAAEIRDAMRSYGQKEYNLVFGHGYEYNAPAVEIAKDFPNTVFVSSSGGETAENAGAFRFNLEQGFYLAGMMAADMSKSGVVAMIGGPDVPSIRSTFKAFRAGAEATKPGIRVIENFTGSGDDVAKAKQATLAAISEGADFVIHQANAAGQGVFNACKEKGVYAFGSNLDQNSNESGVVIASAVINAKAAFPNLAKQVKEGKFKGSVVLMGMKDDAIDFVINPAMKDKVPAELVQKLDATKEKIRKGELEVPKDDF